VHVHRATPRLVRQVDARHRLADHAEVTRRLWCHVTPGVTGEVDRALKLPVGRCLVARPSAHRSVDDVKLVNPDAEACGSGREKRMAHLGAGLSQSTAALAERSAACGHALVGAAFGIGRDHANARDVDVELVGGDLSQRGHKALTDLDLAAAHLDDAIGGKRNPAIKAKIAGKARGKLRSRHLIPSNYCSWSRWHAGSPS